MKFTLQWNPLQRLHSNLSYSRAKNCPRRPYSRLSLSIFNFFGLYWTATCNSKGKTGVHYCGILCYVRCVLSRHFVCCFKLLYVYCLILILEEMEEKLTEWGFSDYIAKFQGYFQWLTDWQTSICRHFDSVRMATGPCVAPFAGARKSWESVLAIPEFPGMKKGPGMDSLSVGLRMVHILSVSSLQPTSWTWKGCSVIYESSCTGISVLLSSDRHHLTVYIAAN